MRYLVRHQGRSGGFRSCFGLGSRRHPHAEVTWTAKLYLDAALLQVRAAFDAVAATAPDASPVPDRIDSEDGRVQTVRCWVEHLGADARVADVGCGRGRYLNHLRRWCPSVELTGIDFSPAMLDALPQGVAPLCGSLLQIPAADGAFDSAFAVESLEHSLLPRRAVAELCRVVRPGGRVLIIDKHRAHQPRSHHEPWERWFTPRELTDWLTPHCHDVTVCTVPHSEGLAGADLFLAAEGTRSA
jgi:malonyl-CoA O-methyltransferase